MKCIIPLARGGGYEKDRNRVSYLATVAGKPLLGYLIDQLLPVKPEEIIFILDEHDKDLIAYVKNHYDFPMRFVMQKHTKGSAHAIYGAREFVDGELLILFGDTFFQGDIKGLSTAAVDGIIWTNEVDDPRELGVVFLNDGYASKLIEKPDEPVSNLAMIGLYYFKDASAIFGAIKHLLDHKIQTKGSFQITDAIEYLIGKGKRIATRPVKGWIDADHGDGLFQLQRQILGKQNKLLGKVQDVVLRKPVFIAKGALVQDCVLGPNVSIGEGSHVKGCVVKESIICSHASVRDAALTQSVIGSGASVVGVLRQLDLAPGAKVRLD